MRPAVPCLALVLLAPACRSDDAPSEDAESGEESTTGEPVALDPVSGCQAIVLPSGPGQDGAWSVDGPDSTSP